MGILDFLFKLRPPPQELNFEIIKGQLSIDARRYKVRVRNAGREFYAEDLFQQARKPEDLRFSRFFILDEKPVLPHFAPSLQDTVDWFTGRKHPKDGYNTIWWGEQVTFTCAICQASRVAPLRITKVERLAVATSIPRAMEIVGWRVSEVETALTGAGLPTKRLDDYKTYPVLTWDKVPNQYLCGNCARKLADLGRWAEVGDYFVFETE